MSYCVRVFDKQGAMTKRRYESIRHALCGLATEKVEWVNATLWKEGGKYDKQLAQIDND